MRGIQLELRVCKDKLAEMPQDFLTTLYFRTLKNQILKKTVLPYTFLRIFLHSSILQQLLVRLTKQSSKNSVWGIVKHDLLHFYEI